MVWLEYITDRREYAGIGLIWLLLVFIGGLPFECANYCLAASSDKVTVESICEQARKYYDDGKIGLSIMEYERAIMLAPDSHEAFRGRGLDYLRMGRFEKALADFEKANEEMGPYREQKFPGLGGYLDWQTAHDQYLQANKKLEDGNYAEAIEMYKAALTIYPPFPQCLHNLGIALSKTGDHKAAGLKCMEAISFRQSDWKFWKTMAIELHMQGRYRTALRAMEHAKELNPPFPDQVEIIESIENIKDALHQAKASTFFYAEPD